MADAPHEYEEAMEDDPFAAFQEWATEVDERAYADL